MELKFNFHEVTQPEPLQRYCEDRFQHLTRLSPELLRAEIDFHHSSHHRKGDFFLVDARLHKPGKVLYTKKKAQSFNEAIDQVVEALKKQLERSSKRKERLNKFVRPFKSISDRFFRR